MLKILAIVAVVLAVMPPMPGQAVKAPAQGADKRNEKSQRNQGTSAPALPFLNKMEQPAATKPYGGHVAGEDKENSIKLISLPPVTISDKNKTWVDHVFDWGPWIFNLLLVAVGGLQVWYLGKTLRALRDSSERQLRAYVVAEAGSIGNVANPAPMVGEYTPTEARITHPGWGPVARLSIKNTGQTPAYDVEHWGSLCYREHPLKTKLPAKPSTGPSFRSVLGPNIPITKTLSFGRRLTPEEVQNLMDGKGALYFNGEIVYRDAFNKSHVTRYRLIYCAPPLKIGISTDFSFAEEGNNAD